MGQLVEKTVDTYCGAFPSPALARGRAELVRGLLDRYADSFAEEGWGPRFFVRTAIEVCEATRLLGLSSLAEALR